MDTDRLDTEGPLLSNTNNVEQELNIKDRVQEMHSQSQFQEQQSQKQNSQKTSTIKESQEQLGSRDQMSQKSRQSKKQDSMENSVKNIILDYGDQLKEQRQNCVSNQSSKQNHKNDASMFNLFTKQNQKENESNKSLREQSNQNQNEDFRLIDLDQVQIDDQTTGSPQFQIKNMNSDLDNCKDQHDDSFEFVNVSTKNQAKKQNSNQEQSCQYNESEFLEYDGIVIKKIEIPKHLNKKTLQKMGVARYLENSLLKKSTSKESNKEGIQEEKKQAVKSDQDQIERKPSLKVQEKTHFEIVIREPVKTENSDQHQKEAVKQFQQDTIFQNQQIKKKAGSNHSGKLNQFQVIKRDEIFEENKQLQSLKGGGRKHSSSLNEQNQKNKFIKFKKIKLVRKMIKVFEKFHIIKRFSNIPAYYFRFFGDKASFFKSKEDEQNLIQKLKKKMNKNQYKKLDTEQEEKVSRLVLFQDSKIILLFKFLIIISAIMQCFYISTQIAFSQTFKPEQKFDVAFTIIPSVFFLLDIYVNFNLAYYQNGKLVFNRRQIALNYFFGRYWLDFIALVLQLGLDKSIPTLLYRLYQIQFELERVLASYQIQVKFYYSYRVIRLVMELILSSHILSCIFILAAAYSPSDNNWIYQNNLQNQPNDIIYLNSLYYIVVTVATIGYGDIHPVSSTEKMFLIFIAFITTGLFAYNVSTISSIVNDIVRKKLKTKKQILGLTQYMTERNISRQIQNQILQQLYYNMKTEKSSSQLIDKCLQHVSENLKGSLFNEYFGNILDTNKYFKRKFSKQFLQSIIPKFKEEVYAPGEKLFTDGDTEQKLIYLRKGEIVLYLNQSDPVPIVSEYKENNWVGYEDFFTGEPKSCNAKCKDFVNIIYITRKDFLEVIKQFPKDNEKFCMIKDKILFSNITIKQSCNICHSIFHQIHTCPYVHFAQKKEYIITKSLFQLTSKREPYENRRRNKKNSLVLNEQVRFQLKNIRIQYLILANGINTQDFQIKIKQSESILENYNLSFAKKEGTKSFDRNQQSIQTNLNNNYVIQDEVKEKAHDQVEEIQQKRLSVNQQNNQQNSSQRGDQQNQPQIEEIISPISIRRTNHSFKIDNNSMDQKVVQIQTETSIMQNQKEGNAIGNESNQSQSQNNSKKKIVEWNTQIKDSDFKKQEQQVEEEKQSKFQSSNQKQLSLNSERKRNIFKILPAQLESDQEFFQKYDQIKWQNNEVYIVDNEDEILPSYQSLNQFDQELEAAQSGGVNQSIQSNLIKNKLFGMQQYQNLEPLGFNLNIINEDINQEDLGDLEASTLPFGLVKQRPNEQQILKQILFKVENIKTQQEQLRIDQLMKDQNIESKIKNTIYRTLTFSLKNIANIPENHIHSEQSAKFFDNMSFGQRQTDEIDEISESDKIYKQKNKAQTEMNLSIQQSNLIKLKEFQNNQLINSSQVNLDIKNSQKQDAAQNIIQQSKQITLLNNLQKQMDMKENNKQFDIQFQNKKAILAYQEKKLREKFELSFFLAFERQNNWKTYFPTQNLSYITKRMISQQRILFNSSILFKNQKPKKSKFRRLSELIQENRDKRASEQSSLNNKKVIPKYKKN